MSRTFFDTNVLVHLFDEDAPEKKARAAELYARETQADRAALSTQVLQEFYVVVTRKLAAPLPSHEAERASPARRTAVKAACHTPENGP